MPMAIMIATTFVLGLVLGGLAKHAILSKSCVEAKLAVNRIVEHYDADQGKLSFARVSPPTSSDHLHSSEADWFADLDS